MVRRIYFDAHYGQSTHTVRRNVRVESNQLHETAIRRAEQNSARRNADLLSWGQYFLPTHFRLPPSAMHRWVAERLDAATDVAGAQAQGLQPLGLNEAHALKLNLVGPRGSAKSTVVTLAFVLREALSGRQPYIWIVSDTRHQACAHLDAVKAELEENPQLAELYPEAHGVGPVWRRGTLVLRNGTMIEAFGTGQRVRGRRRKEHRPTLIVCDDLQNDGHIQSALARDTSRSWFHGLLMKAGTPRTTIINLGTALHRECLAMELTRTPGWTSRTFKSIERWPDHMPLWHEWEEIYCQPRIEIAPFSARASGPEEVSAEFELRSAESQASVTPHSELGAAYSAIAPHVDTDSAHQDSNSTVTSSGPLAQPLNVEQNTSSDFEPARRFYLRNQTLMHLGSQLLWPAQENLYTLMCMRAESGHTAFDREKQSEPVNPDMCEWPEEYFGDWIWFDQWPPLTACGLASAKPQAALLLKAIALDPSKGTDARRGDYSAFVLLGVAADGVLYLEADLKRRPTPQMVTDGIELCRRFNPHVFGIESNQFQELLGADFAAEFTRQGFVGIAPCSIENRTSKAVRIRRLGPLLAARRLRFKTNSPGTRMLVDQLKEFPTASHDDGPDAAEMALRLAEAYLRPTPNDGLGNRLINWN